MNRNTRDSTDRSPRAFAGMTLIEMVVAIAVVVVAFVGLFDLFKTSVLYVETAQAREEALSLAVERMEELRALPYASLGTVAGIPPGSIPQNETITEGHTTYTRRTLIAYYDDPADGLGSADTNSIMSDYKVAKVDVSWEGPKGALDVPLTSNFIPSGIETNAGGGTLSIAAINALGAPVPGAAVRIVNTTGTSSIDVTTYANDSGFVFFPGTPAASGYQITVTAPGYSTAQTYSIDATNQNPNPGNLTIVEGQTTSASFAIDRLASLLVRTWLPILPATTTDTFASGSGIASAVNAEVSGGALALTPDDSGAYPSSGGAYSTTTAPNYLSVWSSLSWYSTLPSGTGLTLHLYQLTGGSNILIPDSVVPGNSVGFTTSPIALGSISTSTYPSLVIGADFTTSDASSTPAVLDWSLSYRAGPTPQPAVPFVLQGAKSIGTTGAGATIYKTLDALLTDSSAQYATTTLEWDSYTLAVPPSSGYDVASYCPLNPVAVAPASAVVDDLYVLPHTANTLLVSIRDQSTGLPIPNATVALSRAGFGANDTTNPCGNVFFSGLTANSDYTLAISASGYTATSTANVSVSGQSTFSLSL